MVVNYSCRKIDRHFQLLAGDGFPGGFANCPDACESRRNRRQSPRGFTQRGLPGSRHLSAGNTLVSVDLYCGGGVDVVLLLPL